MIDLDVAISSAQGHIKIGIETVAPSDERQGCSGKYDRHEPAAYPIQLTRLDRRSAVLCIGDHGNKLRYYGARAH